MKNKKSKAFLFVFIILSYSCGDIFATRNKIIRNYYLFEEDASSDFSIRYKLKSGDYIGRVPAKIIEYGYKDSVLVAKCFQYGRIKYYVLNMKSDFEFADEKDYLIDTFSNEGLFFKKWANVKLKKVL
jgi:hypothetical protein